MVCKTKGVVWVWCVGVGVVCVGVVCVGVGVVCLYCALLVCEIRYLMPPSLLFFLKFALAL